MSSEGTQTPGPTCAPGTLEEELEKIEREQSEVVDLEAKERELEELHQRARTLAGELRAARTARRQRSAEGALPVIQPREPCSAAWEDMAGDERVRACGKCKARVYDLGGLDPSEARRLISEREGRLPTHVVGRVDGTVTVDSCAEKKKRLSPMAVGLAAFGAVGLLMSGLAAGYMLGGGDEPKEPTAVAEAPMEVQTLVNELVKKRTREALEQARAKAEAEPPAPPTPPEPPARKARPDDDGFEDRADGRDRRHERRRRGRCERRRHGHIHMHSPFSLFFWESAFDGGSLEDCDPD
jgi:hypothetical protein